MSIRILKHRGAVANDDNYRSPQLPFQGQSDGCLDVHGISRHFERVGAPTPLDDSMPAIHTPLSARWRANQKLADILAGVYCDQTLSRLRLCTVTVGLHYCSNCIDSFYYPCHCRLRLCAHCAPLLSWRRSNFVALLIGHMHHPCLLTLTQKRSPSLAEGITTLRAAWTKFRHNGVGAKIWGGLMVIEAKPKPDGWHVHLHSIADMPFIPKNHIYKAWAKCLHQSSASCDIKAISDIRGAMREVAKYAVKPTDLLNWSPAQVREFAAATRKKRLEGTYGCFYNCKAEDYLDQPTTLPRQCPTCGATNSIYPISSGPASFGRDWTDIFERFFAKLPLFRYMPHFDCPDPPALPPGPELFDRLKAYGDHEHDDTF